MKQGDEEEQEQEKKKKEEEDDDDRREFYPQSTSLIEEVISFIQLVKRTRALGPVHNSLIQHT